MLNVKTQLLYSWLAGSPGITVMSRFRSECWMRESERGEEW